MNGAASAARNDLPSSSGVAAPMPPKIKKRKLSQGLQELLTAAPPGNAPAAAAKPQANGAQASNGIHAGKPPVLPTPSDEMSPVPHKAHKHKKLRIVDGSPAFSPLPASTPDTVQRKLSRFAGHAHSAHANGTKPSTNAAGGVEPRHASAAHKSESKANKRKSVTFGLKNNLFFSIGEPPMEPSVRTPPAARPKGPALKVASVPRMFAAPVVVRTKSPASVPRAKASDFF